MSAVAARLSEVSPSPVATSDVVLLDLDGVVYRGPDAVPHAASALATVREAGVPIRFVTNNANRPPEAVAAHLTELGVPAHPDDVATAAQAAARLVASEWPAGTAVLVIGGPGLREAIAQVGLRVVDSADDAPSVVVQGFAPTVGWAELSEAVLAIRAGAQHVASNLDATLPQARGEMLGNGSLVAAVVNATGVVPRSTGKPDPGIFRQAAGAERRPVVVGDRLDTDLAGARAAGMTGMHVLTGVDDASALLRCVPEQRPDLLALDLRGLLEPHPAVVADGDGFRCRDARARVSAGRLELIAVDGRARSVDAGSITLDELRAACVAAWSASDAAGIDSVLTAPVPSVEVVDVDQGRSAIA